MRQLCKERWREDGSTNENKQIINMQMTNNPLENLEQIPKQVVSQTVKLPGQIVGQMISGIVGSKTQTNEPQKDPLTGLEIPSSQKVQNLQKQENKRKQTVIPHAQQMIQGFQRPQNPQIPKYLAGKPGFDQERAIKQMKGEIIPSKRELPPAIAAVKRKFSTNERKGGAGS